MAAILKRFSFLFPLVLIYVCSHSSVMEAQSAAAPSFKTVQNSGGGAIVYGPLGGQETYQAALGQMLKQVEADYGDKPQLGSLLQSRRGSVWEAFCTFSNKKKGNTAMTGLVIVYAPQSGTAGGATLIDTTANFTKSANSMLQRLVQEVTNNAKAAQSAPKSGAAPPAASASSAPAQKLTPYIFPDGSGSMGLPPGWTPTRAQMGDVTAKGPNGEVLRFGMLVVALDPNLPSSRALTGGRNAAPGSMVLVPYNQDPAAIYQQTVNQLAQKNHMQPATFTFQQTKDLGRMQAGKNYMLFGNVDRHDGSGIQSTIIEIIIGPDNPQMMGYQMKLFQITGPPQVIQQDAATIAEIFPNYSLNTRYINAVAIQGIQQIIVQQRADTAYFNQQMASTDLMSQGMSDYLRGESVFVDSDTGTHYRGPDDLASALQNANPNRFQTLPLGSYIHGIDY